MNPNCTLCGSPHHLPVVHSQMPLAAIWFPPYGNPGAQPGSGSESNNGAVTFAAVLKAHEDRVSELMGNMSEAQRAIAYKFLYATGMRIGTVDEELRRAIRKELRASGTQL